LYRLYVEQVRCNQLLYCLWQKARYYLRPVPLRLCLVVVSDYYYLAIDYVEIPILQHPISLMYT
jgi:hypothetical protein